MTTKLKEHIAQLKKYIAKMEKLDRVQTDDVVAMITILIKMYDCIFKK